MNLLGENFVKIVGIVKNKKATTYDNGNTLFKCNIAVPAQSGNGTYQYMKVSTWINEDDDLFTIKDGTWIKVMGHIEEKSYDSKCRYCNGPQKNYWTDVVIDNYVILGGDI